MGGMGYYHAYSKGAGGGAGSGGVCQERGVTTLSQISLDCSGLSTFAFFLPFTIFLFT